MSQEYSLSSYEISGNQETVQKCKLQVFVFSYIHARAMGPQKSIVREGDARQRQWLDYCYIISINTIHPLSSLPQTHIPPPPSPLQNSSPFTPLSPR